MMEITPAHYTVLSAALFTIGVIGVLLGAKLEASRS